MYIKCISKIIKCVPNIYQMDITKVIPSASTAY